MKRLIPALQLSTRAGGAAALALAMAAWLELPLPIFAMVAAVIVTDLSPTQTRKLALPRIAGTVIGATLGAIARPWLPGGPLAIGIGIFAAMLACRMLRMDDATKLSGFVCGSVLLEYGAEPWLYAATRLVETLLGIGAAVLVSMVPKLIRVEEPVSPGP